jgi:hypothetical protein
MPQVIATAKQSIARPIAIMIMSKNVTGENCLNISFKGLQR